MSDLKHLFWDSCVFIRYLTSSPIEYVDDIARYISDAKNGERSIYYSTIAYTEIANDHLKPNYGSMQEFFATWENAFYPIEPNPNILRWAGELHHATPTNPDPSQATSRTVGTPDAIHLMTCVYARDVLSVDDIVFHTLDRGRTVNWEGRTVPIIGFERWFSPAQRTGHVKNVCDLSRMYPEYPNRDLLSGSRDGTTIVVQDSDTDKPF